MGNPLRLLLGHSQQADCQLAAMPGINNVLGDKGYDTGKVVAYAKALGMQIVITIKKNRRFRHFLQLDARYDKTANNFWGKGHFISALHWLSELHA
jgi:hypothetical protein